MRQACRECGSAAVLYVHSTAMNEHRWSGGDESLCACVPALMCAVCHHDFLRDRAFVLLGDDDAPKQESALIH